MIDERHVFALRFRELAERYAILAGNPDGLKEYACDNAAGELVGAAHRSGFLALPGLVELLAWADGLEPEGGRCVRVPCPANVFIEVCGFHSVPAVIASDGTGKIVGDHTGGIIPTMLENSPALHRPKQAQACPEQHETTLENRSLVCKLLADEIERTSAADARDCWVYEQATIGRPWQWIADNIPNWCPDREQVTTPNGAKKAGTRYAEKHGLPAIPKRKSGRPRNTN